MGLQLSVLVGCVGALELLACLKHMFVCIFKLTDQPSHCCIDYFHRSRISDDFVIVDKSYLEDENKQTCSEIEAILRETRSEPNILCIGPPPIVDGYVRIPTPIPFGIDDEIITGQKSSSNPSSLVDSGNENPTTKKSNDDLLVTVKQYNGSSSDVSSLEDTENPAKSTSRKLFRRSRTPEFHGGSHDDYDDGEEEDVDHQKKHHKITKTLLSSSSRRSARSKAKITELGKSAENLSTTTRRSKRHREPERCKSDIQIQVARNLLRDEWTNTSPMDSDGNLSRASSKRSISVLIQTSFEDKLHFSENNSFQNLDVGSKLNACPNCRCRDGCNESRVRQVTETASVDGKPQLIKISSFEEASGDDYEKFKTVISSRCPVSKKGAPKDWNQKIKSSIDSESFDEYVDAEEEGLTFSEQPIQYTIPDTGDNQAFWVIRRSPHEEYLSHFPHHVDH